MTTPTAEESRVLLEREAKGEGVSFNSIKHHLRAALDREAAFRAVLEGAQYRNLEDIVSSGVDYGRALGGQIAAMTIDLRARAEIAEAERDAARAEAERLRAATVAEAVAVIEALATEWPHGWVPSHEAMSRIYALASEPSQ